jgi:hypothetical protein
MATKQEIWDRLQNARDEMMDEAGRDHERMRDLPAGADLPEGSRVRVSDDSGLRGFAGLVGYVTYTGDGHPPSKRGWVVVDFKSGVIGRRQHFPFRPEELEPAR